jgi:hypothetical protein
MKRRKGKKRKQRRKRKERKNRKRRKRKERKNRKKRKRKKNKTLFLSKINLNLRNELVKCCTWNTALHGDKTWTLKNISEITWKF